LRRKGEKVAILAFGSMLAPSLHAAELLNASVANMRYVKPLDEELVSSLASGHDLLVTAEENVIEGGAGSAVAECLQQLGITVPLLHLGLPDKFLEQGDPAQMLAACGLDSDGITTSIRRALSE
jgi:1-deoxy-D-xylulose-5-phosphate synthase